MRYAVILTRNNVWHWEGSSREDAMEMFSLLRQNGVPVVLVKIIADSEIDGNARSLDGVPNIFEPATVS